MKKRILPFLISILTLMVATTFIPVAAVSVTETLLVVDVNYRSQSELAYLTSGYDVWQVDPQQQTARLMIDQAQYRQLVRLGYQVTLAVEETRMVNQPMQALPGQLNGIPGLPCYRTVEETYAAAQSLATFHPTLVTWTKIGESWEKITPEDLPGYDLMVLKLSNTAITGDKPKILISSGMHARELAPVELNLRFAEYLVGQYGIDADVTWLLDYHEIHLLLVTNPDGRKQAETGLSWRKNTNENYCGATSDLRGADLNRNFPFHWGDAGTNPCDYNYQGPAALSEPESQALKAYELALFPDQRGPNDNDPAPDDTTGIFIDLHSYGELVLWPYGFDFTSTAPNHTQLQTLGRKLAYFNDYSPKQASALYPATGASDDDAYGTLGIAAYTIEMGTGTFSPLCTTFENTIYPDNLQTLLYAAKVARTPYQTPAGPDAINLSVPGGQLAFNQPFELSAIISDMRYKSDGSTEPTQIIQAARYSIDSPPWDEDALLLPLVASDGLFDEKVESVTAMVLPIGLSGGGHTIYVQGQDANGNWGPVSAVFFDLSYGIYLPVMAR